MRAKAHRHLLLGTVFAGALLGAVQSAAASETLGFAVTWFGFAFHNDKTTCPDGFALRPEAKDIVAAFPEKERTRLLLPESMKEMDKLMFEKGPHKEDICEHPEIVAEPPMRTPQSKVSYGVNLDGDDGNGPAPANTCKHENFTGLDGEKGVDNQIYRALGCVFGWSQDGIGGYLSKYENGMMHDGEATILIEVKDVDDPKNDDDVTVGIYNGQESLVKNAAGDGILGDSTLTAKADPLWQNITKGKIVNGVLHTTKPINVHVHQAVNTNGPENAGGHNFHRAQLKLEFKPDGTAVGVLAGYLDWEAVHRRRIQSAVSNGFTCPANYAAFKKFADGDPDPETGQCMSISAAYRVEAVPAFIVHPPAQTASKQATNTP